MRGRVRIIGAVAAALLLVVGLTAWLWPRQPDTRGSVAAQEWAGKVCTALTPWQTTVGTLTARAQKELAAAAGVPQAKTNVVTMLAGAESASERARASIAEAGAPAVDNGKKYAEQFAGALATARDAYAKAKRTVEQLPTGDATSFATGVQGAMDQLGKDTGAVSTSTLDSPELQKAFDSTPACTQPPPP